MNHQIKHEENEGRGMFFLSDEKGVISKLSYDLINQKIMVINHTETRKNMKNKGFASKILDHVVNYARQNSLKIDPVCPFVVAKFKNNKAYRDLEV